MLNMDGKAVAVVGLGAIANPPLVEFLVSKGAVVTACDRKTPQELGGVYDRLACLPIKFNLGDDYLSELDQYETVYLTPAVRRDLPEVQRAKAAGVTISSEILLFMHLCRSKKVGITGSSGKTTSTSLMGEILRTSGRLTYVAGNIGVSLIKEAEEMSEDAWVALELSSFQLQDFDISPDIALITNVTPNHLDYHPTMDEYAQAKQRLFMNQSKDDYAIFNWDDATTRQMAQSVPGQVLYFSRRCQVSRGAWVDGDRVVVTLNGETTPICRVSDIRLPGLHNLENILGVSAAAIAAGISPDSIREVVTTFSGVEHRFEYVGNVSGVDYYNDSIATTPDRTSAGILALERPIILIAGGYDKKLPFDKMAQIMPGRVRSVLLIGKTTPLIRAAVELANSGAEAPVEIVDCSSLEEAVSEARNRAMSGDVVLLSPACASYDMFSNYQERGTLFKKLVKELS